MFNEGGCTRRLMVVEVQSLPSSRWCWYWPAQQSCAATGCLNRTTTAWGTPGWLGRYLGKLSSAREGTAQLTGPYRRKVPLEAAHLFSSNLVLVERLKQWLFAVHRSSLLLALAALHSTPSQLPESWRLDEHSLGWHNCGEQLLAVPPEGWFQYGGYSLLNNSFAQT